MKYARDMSMRKEVVISFINWSFTFEMHLESENSTVSFAKKM